MDLNGAGRPNETATPGRTPHSLDSRLDLEQPPASNYNNEVPCYSPLGRKDGSAKSAQLDTEGSSHPLHVAKPILHGIVVDSLAFVAIVRVELDGFS